MVTRATVSRFIKPTDRRLELVPRKVIKNFQDFTTNLLYTNCVTPVSSNKTRTGFTNSVQMQWNGVGSDCTVNLNTQPLDGGQPIFINADSIIGVWVYIEIPLDTDLSLSGYARDPNLVKSMTPQTEMRVGNAVNDLTNSVRITRGFTQWSAGWNYLQFHVDSTINYSTGVNGFFDTTGSVTTSGTGYDYAQPLKSLKFYFKSLSGGMTDIKYHIECFEVAPRHVPVIVFGGDSLAQSWVDNDLFGLCGTRNIPMYAATGISTPTHILDAAEASVMENGQPTVDFINHSVNHHNYGTSELPLTADVVRAPLTVYGANAFVVPAGSAFNGVRYKTLAGGTSGSVEPTWTKTGNVTDGSVTWVPQTSTYPHLSRAIIDNDFRTVRDTFISRGYTRALNLCTSPYNTTNTLMESVLSDLGYVMNRGNGSHSASIPSRFGYANSYRIRAFATGNPNSAQYVYDQIDGAIRFGCSVFPFIESIGAGAGDTTLANLTLILDYIKTKRDSGQVLVLSVSEWDRLYL